MSDAGSRVWVFFYGTFMSADVLAKHSVFPRQVVAAKLPGFELSVRPRVNLTRSDRSCAYGALALVTHSELESIYAELKQQFGLIYNPEAVLAETLEGMLRPALCYLVAAMTPGRADPGYVCELAVCVRALGLPEWYARHVESFADNVGEL
jgi:hypothetical protein